MSTCGRVDQALDTALAAIEHFLNEARRRYLLYSELSDTPFVRGRRTVRISNVLMSEDLYALITPLLIKTSGKGS
jgi:hypothetical protein